ncbi:hypothetical protein Tco_0893608 [Tanacetum coccineum]|uniref:Uncharacterized protein n=1 Tax=Tanacetum coccineum TaxID=301880 RepID=A0ABQ5CCL7_9ASTR
MKLAKLINSQVSVNNKFGVGFDNQMNENELHDCHLNKGEVFESASDSSVNEIEEENNQVNDRLDDFVYKTNVSETISSVVLESNQLYPKSSKDSLEQPKDVRPSALIIEEWESDSDDDCVIRPLFEQNKPKNNMVGKYVVENIKKSTGQREVRPVWNNAQRVNHQNKLTHTHPKRNFVPTAILTKSGNVPVNTAKQSSPRAAVLKT